MKVNFKEAFKLMGFREIFLLAMFSSALYEIICYLFFPEITTRNRFMTNIEFVILFFMYSEVFKKCQKN